MKNKNGMIISLDVEKSFDKIKYLFMIKVLERLEIQVTYLNIIKTIDSRPTAVIYLNKENQSIFSNDQDKNVCSRHAYSI